MSNLLVSLVERDITAATINLIGAVNQASMSVMAKLNEKVDFVREYDQPMELSGVGEVVNGDLHVHATLAGEDVVVSGHLHRAVVGGFFVRAYVTELDD